jgi:hypothetical protein
MFDQELEMEGKKMPEAIGAVLDRIEAQQAREIDIGPNGLSVDLLRAVYRSTSIPLQVRIRCAGLALQHEVPRLMATAIINEGSFAELLERRLQRISEAKLIEARPNNGGSPKPTPEVEVKVNRGAVDRRWRRI